jgi:hypothetical protein
MNAAPFCSLLLTSVMDSETSAKPPSLEEKDKEQLQVISQAATHAETHDVFQSEDPIYQAKMHILNNALQEIGMGKYQVDILEWWSIFC